MATAVEQRSLPHLGGVSYDGVRYPHSPQFSNPWDPQSEHNHNHGPYHQPMHYSHAQPEPQQHGRPMYPSTTHSVAPSMAAEQIHHQRQYPEYASSAAPNAPAFSSTSALRYSPEQHYPSVSPYAQYENPPPRRPSYQPPMSGRDSFNDALDASRGMIAMSQDYTPRNIYNPRTGAHDSYGFPSTNSPHSSISSASSYPYYGSYSGSVDGSVTGSSITDYSSTSEDAMPRTLPPPGQVMGNYPPGQSTMMTQFNSKLAASSQKKHKCKVCDKRFTRPSSLQTHMYSHTGEKPFACDFEGCNRHFSVVSNLRRHKKCHRNGATQATPEEEE